MSSAATSLRERKKERTRREIEVATFRLVAERGWAATTIAAIAEAAEVSPRTISAYFSSKLDIVFSTTAERAALFSQCLDDPQVTIVDAIKGWLARAIEDHDHEWERLRWLAVKADNELLAHDRLGFVERAQVVAEAFSRRTGQPAHDPGPQMVGASTMALVRGFRELIDRNDGADFPEFSARGFDLLERICAAAGDA